MLLSLNLKNGVTVVSTNKILPSKILFFWLKTAKHNKKTQKNPELQAETGNKKIN